MAAPHIIGVYTIRDAKGKTSVSKMNFPIASDQAVLVDFLKTTAQLLDPLIKGQIVAIGAGIEVDLPGSGLKTAPLSDSDVEEGARFNWRAASGAFTNWRVPTFDEAKMVTGTPDVDTADTDVAAYVARIEAGKTDTLINVSPSDDRGSDITDLDTARESFTSTRN